MNVKTNQQIAIEVIRGLWGNGYERRNKLISAGYDPDKIQTIVNALMSGDTSPIEVVDAVEIAGVDTMDLTIDLSKYKGINLTFTFGGD